jgi:hypothetical protein
MAKDEAITNAPGRIPVGIFLKLSRPGPDVFRRGKSILLCAFVISLCQQMKSCPGRDGSVYYGIHDPVC